MRRSSAVVVVLVVLTCGGLFVAGIIRARGSHLMMQCTNNLKQFGIGLHIYHDSYKTFPLAITKNTIGPGPQVRTVELPIDKSASWLFEIHPFVEARMDPRFRIDINKPWDSEENRYVADSEYWLAICPAAEFAADKTMNSYIGILGLGRDAGRRPVDDKARGVFDFQIHATKGDVTDGFANTMIIAETALGNGRWIAGGYATARGFDLQGPSYLGPAGQFSSRHPGSTSLAVMADGSVRKLTDKTSDSAFEALATIAGGEAVDPLAD